MNLNQVLAKSDPPENLREHTYNALKIWDKLRKKFLSEIGDNDFWRDSFYSVLFHDFGKICENFILVITGIKNPATFDDRIRHEFFSGMFLLGLNAKYYLNNPLSLAAVFSHHKPFCDCNGFKDIISENRNLTHKIDKKLVDEFLKFALQMGNHFNVTNAIFDFSKQYYVNTKYSKLLLDFEKRFYEVLKSEKLSYGDRKKYIFYKGVLNISDWTSSSHHKLPDILKFDSEHLKRRIISKLECEGVSEIDNKFAFREFQTKSQTPTNIIAIAPTGSGKTEAALLWASTKNEIEKIIYLLPTRVTSNAIFNRLVEYFSFAEVGLVHSTARLYQKEQIDNDYSYKEYLRDKSLFKNINVCTIDQILTIGFNLGFWEVKTFNLYKSRIIIDEIHLYSPYTLGLIIATVKYLQEEFQAKFFIMTATMPIKLSELLKKALGNVLVIHDNELLYERRNIFETRECQLEELLLEVKKSIKENKKVLVVANTVDKAIEIFKYLKDRNKKIKAVCYHSRFINKDRSNKEKEIFQLNKSESGGLLVATQVVEVSLDIDFDILYTENAPIDAIIQRAGRVNRKRKKRNTKVIIAKHSEITEKYVYQEKGILDKTFSEFSLINGQKLSENELNKMVDIVYKEMDIEGHPSFKEGLMKYKKIQYELDWIKDLTSDDKVFTREGLDSVTVIPDQFWEELSVESNPDIISKYLLTISKSRFKQISKKSKRIKKQEFIFIKANYSDEFGLTFKESEKIDFKTY